jgi:hypothetical protein
MFDDVASTVTHIEETNKERNQINKVVDGGISIIPDVDINRDENKTNKTNHTRKPNNETDKV